MKTIKILAAIIMLELFFFKICGFRIIIAQGTSMLPTIRENQITLGKIIKSDQLQIGDLAAYYEEDHLILHRVVIKTDHGYVFKGDNNPGHDDFVFKENIYAKIILY